LENDLVVWLKEEREREEGKEEEIEGKREG
jgi:hypothetical protein